MTLYGLKTCDTCRKALKELPNAQFRDVRADGIDDDVLTGAVQAFGPRLVNTRSATWRGLSESERAMPPYDLIRAHPAVMKRPLIEHGGQLFLGWDAATRAALGVDQ